MYHLSRRRAPPPALESPGECSATAQVVQSMRLYVENRCIFGGALKICKALNALSPTPGTSARVRRDERDQGGELARLTHTPSRVLTRARDTRKLESQMFPPPPQPPPVGRAAGGLRLRARRPRGACFPSEQGLELSISPHGFMQTRPTRGGIETEKQALSEKHKFKARR